MICRSTQERMVLNRNDDQGWRFESKLFLTQLLNLTSSVFLMLHFPLHSSRNWAWSSIHGLLKSSCEYTLPSAREIVITHVFSKSSSVHPSPLSSISFHSFYQATIKNDQSSHLYADGSWILGQTALSARGTQKLLSFTNRPIDASTSLPLCFSALETTDDDDECDPDQAYLLKLVGLISQASLERASLHTSFL